MSLTPAQRQTMLTDITVTNNAEFGSRVANNEDQPIADAYNAPASPDFWVWKTMLLVKEVYEAASVDGTTWSTPAYISRSVGERDAWRDVYAIPGAFNPSLPNARAGLADIFSGPSGAGQRAHLLAIGRRLATRAERLLATGAGSTASPGTLTFEGKLFGRDIAQVFGRGGAA